MLCVLWPCTCQIGVQLWGKYILILTQCMLFNQMLFRTVFYVDWTLNTCSGKNASSWVGVESVHRTRCLAMMGHCCKSNSSNVCIVCMENLGSGALNFCMHLWVSPTEKMLWPKWFWAEFVRSESAPFIQYKFRFRVNPCLKNCFKTNQLNWHRDYRLECTACGWK